MSQLSDKVLIFRYFWATCPHSDELPATSRLIFYKKMFGAHATAKHHCFQKFRWPGGTNDHWFAKKSRFLVFSAHCGQPRWFCSWTHDGEIHGKSENTANTGKCWGIYPKWHLFGTSGELLVIQTSCRRILQSFVIKKSLSLEPSKNHVVLGIRVYFSWRTSADRMLVSVTNMGGRGHIYIYTRS